MVDPEPSIWVSSLRLMTCSPLFYPEDLGQSNAKKGVVSSPTLTRSEGTYTFTPQLIHNNLLTRCQVHLVAARPTDS